MLKSRIGRFLGIHAAYAATSVSYVPQGVNAGNEATVRAVVPHNLTAGTDTFTVNTANLGMDPDFMPIDALIPTYTPPATGTAWVLSGYLQVTQHDCSTGITTLKAVNITGALADAPLSGDICVVRYAMVNTNSTTV